MIDKMNILVLHRMGDPLYWRQAVRELEYMLPTYAPDHNYIVHDGERPLPAYIKDVNFHGIVLGPTFLCNRYNPKIFAQCLNDYDFIRTSNAYKVALPQDDYDCSAILDKWMMDWRVDLVFSVCPNNWPILYPEYSKTNCIRLGYTGYVSDFMIESWQNPKPIDQRSIDVSYRANNLPPNFGRIGKIKGEIGGIFTSKVAGANLKLDISTNPEDMIPGSRWHSFIENSKFCLATISGSSLLDAHGEIRAKVARYLALHPKATFEEVEQSCFSGEDGRYNFTAISPRNIEAALAETVQIATVGNYNGILHCEEHYIPLEADCSNISEVLTTMRDSGKVHDIARKCKEAILSVNNLRFRNHVAKMIIDIANGSSTRNVLAPKTEGVERLIERYQIEYVSTVEAFWKKRRMIRKFRKVAVQLGAHRVKHLIGKMIGY